ncbi:MAG: membrane protein insertion efficiency factor YidD [Candidatus Omnitrophota bacterium]
MRKTALSLIRLYKKISFLLPPSRCRYTPSCSAYAQEAFTRYSFMKALRLSSVRLLHCHPFTKGGFDPVR